MKRVKRILLVLMAVLMAAALCGCGAMIVEDSETALIGMDR